MTKNLGLSSKGSFVNSSAISNSAMIYCQPQLFLSPSGNFLAQLDDQCNHQVYNTNNYEPLRNNITYKLTSLVFTADDKYIIYSTHDAIIQYDILSNKQIIIANSPKNTSTISQLTLSTDCRTIFYLNNSQIYSYSLVGYNSSANLIIPENKSCNFSNFVVDPHTSGFITSSPNCNLCRWDSNNGLFTLTASNNVSSIYPNCTINQLYLSNHTLYLAKKYSTIMNTVSIYQINPQNLSLANTFTNLIQMPQQSFVIASQNYIVVNLVRLSTLWISKDFLSSNISSYSLGNNIKMKHSVYNPYKQEYYQYVQTLNANGTNTYIDISKQSFKCNSSNTLSITCPCTAPQIYNKSSMQCMQPSCSNVNGSDCCTLPYRFKSFNLQCVLDCTTVTNAMLTQPFGTPSRCNCVFPYSWIPETLDCRLNCSQIVNSISQGVKNDCVCKDNSLWSLKQNCYTKRTNPIDPIGPNPIPVPPHTVNQTQPKDVLTFVFIALSGLLLLFYIIFYCKKIRGRQITKKSKEEGDHQAATDRPLSKNANIPTTIVSHQKLDDVVTKAGSDTLNKQKVDNKNQNLQNFSIDEDDEEDRNKQLDDEIINQAPPFSEIASNIQNPLKQ